MSTYKTLKLISFGARTWVNKRSAIYVTHCEEQSDCHGPVCRYLCGEPPFSILSWFTPLTGCFFSIESTDRMKENSAPAKMYTLKYIE